MASLAEIQDQIRKQREAAGQIAPAQTGMAAAQTLVPVAAPQPSLLAAAPSVQKTIGPDGQVSYTQVGAGTVTAANVSRGLSGGRGTLSVAGVTPDEWASRNQVVEGINRAADSIRRGRLEMRADQPDAIGDAARAELARMDTQAANQSQTSLAQARLGLDRQNALANQSLQRDELDATRQNALANQSLGLGRLEMERERNQASLAAALNKGSPYQSQLQKEQAKMDAERAQKSRDAAGNINEMLAKFERLNSLTDVSGLFGPPLATASALVGGQRAAKAEEFNSLANSLVTGMAKSLPGALSDKDVAFLKATMPQMSNTPAGNRQILANLRNFALQNAKSAGVDMDQVINRRGEALAAAGLTQEQIAKRLREEFAGAY
ncbi:MAG: hypothetical protein V9G98_10240 [Candidatus Competibacter sp.]